MSSLVGQSHRWLVAVSPAPDARSAGRSAKLIAAVAAVVGLAAERARAAGDFAALRDAIERALDAAAPASADPRDGPGTDLPRIVDADPALEESRLRNLLARLQPG
jgi:hypothetical protein